MQILALMTSYRQDGNTAHIVRQIQAHMERLAAAAGEPLTFETLDLGHMDIRPCRGCRVCFDRGEDKCPLDDDLRATKARLDAADGILLASPVYVDDVNGIAKNWIDRLAYLCHRPGLAGKSAYLVATAGMGPFGHTLGTMGMALRTWGCDITGQAGFVMGALMTAEEAEAQFGARTEKIARRFYRAVHDRHAENPSLVSLLFFRVQQRSWMRSADGSVDDTYWREHGWIDPARSYYIPHRAHPLKVAVARLAGDVIARFIRT